MKEKKSKKASLADVPQEPFGKTRSSKEEDGSCAPQSQMAANAKNGEDSSDNGRDIIEFIPSSRVNCLTNIRNNIPIYQY